MCFRRRSVLNQMNIDWERARKWYLICGAAIGVGTFVFDSVKYFRMLHKLRNRPKKTEDVKHLLPHITINSTVRGLLWPITVGEEIYWFYKNLKTETMKVIEYEYYIQKAQEQRQEEENKEE